MVELDHNLNLVELELALVELELELVELNHNLNLNHGRACHERVHSR